MPAGIARFAYEARLSHLAIFRDIYYIADLCTPSRRFAADDSPFFAAARGEDAMLRNRTEHSVDYP